MMPDDTNSQNPQDNEAPLTPSEPITSSEQPTIDETPNQISPEVEPTTPEASTVMPNPEVTPVAPVVADKSVAQPPKKSKKKLILISVISALVVLLLGGSALAYILIRQNPQQILGDAIGSLYQAKAVDGTFEYEAGSSTADNKVTVRFDSSSNDNQYGLNVAAKVTSGDQDITLKGNGAYDKDGNAYFKLTGIKRAVETISGGAMLPIEYTTLINKYENKWVKVAASDLRDVSKDAEKNQKCLKDLNAKLQESQFKKDVTNTYKKNQFVVIKDKLQNKNGSVGYVVDVDENISNAFSNDFQSTESYKSIKASCEDLFKADSSDSSSSSDSDAKVIFWISEWEHKLKTIEITSNDDSAKYNSTINLSHDEQSAIAIPRDTISFSELVDDFTKASEGMYSSSSSSSLNKNE